MAALVAEVQGLVLVERRLFSLVGVEAVSTPEGAEWIQWRTDPPEPGFLYVKSGGEDHYAQVNLQVWDGEPPRDASDPWETAADVTMQVSREEVRLGTLTSGPAEVEGLPLSAGPYRLRAYCRGRGAIAELLDQDGDGDLDEDDLDVDWPEGVEAYLFQLWPQA